MPSALAPLTGDVLTPKIALTRAPGKNFTKCISCHPLRNTISLERAREQHAHYCRTLAELGLEVISIPPDDVNADACFVEDNAVVHKGKALICRMAKESRRGEIGPVEEVLSQYKRVKSAEPPATVEGGDVIHLPDRLISGVSERTNPHGVQAMRDWLEVRIDELVDPKMMHLKSYVTFIGRGTVVATESFRRHKALGGLRVLVTPKGEEYAADTLAVGEVVLMPAGRPRAAETVRQAGFEVRAIDVSEFEKCDGAVTCLSIIL
jgi:dimethylargininase